MRAYGCRQRATSARCDDDVDERRDVGDDDERQQREDDKLRDVDDPAHCMSTRYAQHECAHHQHKHHEYTHRDDTQREHALTLEHNMCAEGR